MAGPIFLAVLLALLFASLFELVPISPLCGKVRLAIVLLYQAKQTGLRAIYTRRDPRARKYLEKTLGQSKLDDEILVIGRTHSGLLRDFGHVITDAVKRGVVVKMLMLDRDGLAGIESGQLLDLRSLQLKDAHWGLARDSHDAESRLRELRDNCRRAELKGSLLIYRTKVLIQNSVIIHVPHDTGSAMHIIYDFSFGEEPADKFMQRYEFPFRESSTDADFCNRLSAFYKRMFNLNVCSFAHDLSYSPLDKENRSDEIERTASERIRGFIRDQHEFEAVRNNVLRHLVPAAADVFKSLRNSGPPPQPLSVQIELTNKCSTACSHCYRYRTPDRDVLEEKKILGEMDYNRALQLLSQLKQFKVRTVTFSGGEPTQHSRFAEILCHADEKQDLDVGVLSNGVGLTDEVLDDIRCHARWLRLSIDGSNAYVYGRVRRSLVPGGDAFAQAESAIRRFLAKKETKGGKCRLAICYTIQTYNATDVENMIAWVRQLGIPESDRQLTFKFAHGENGFLCTEAQFNDFYQKVLRDKDLMDSANLRYLRWFLESQSSLTDLVAGRPTLGLYLRQPTRCFTPYLFSLIDPGGDVFPCCFLYEDNKDYSEKVEMRRYNHKIKNVFSMSFEDIWRGEDYERIREELAVIDPTVERYKACGQCIRHCNHNIWLSRLYEEYDGVCDAGADGDRMMSRIVKRMGNLEAVWL